ncbi:hypothetical protein GCM10023321_68970 [Pseudonocardia eucalypti]|uniref:Secreted protein n=1 Tax=Pseudonocardia eucalypti TaxID=648755 RepID=A0ABP9R2T1_9PSEU|nr:hypothetical protein [Pseudonocardia eucalypti]
MRLRYTLALAAAGGALLLGVGTAAADDLDTDSLSTDSVSSSDPTDSVNTDSEDTDSDSPKSDDTGKSPLGSVADVKPPTDLGGLGGLGGL